MQITTSASAEGANPRHPTGHHVQIDDDVELGDLARKVSVGDAITMKQAPPSTASDSQVVQTKAQRLRARIQFATLCWALYLAGWNDATTGPLLPRIQKVYHVSIILSGMGRLWTLRWTTWTGQLCCSVSDFCICLHRGSSLLVRGCGNDDIGRDS